jgi:hypothetical protein
MRELWQEEWDRRAVSGAGSRRRRGRPVRCPKARALEWPDDSSIDGVGDALIAAGTPLPLSSGQPFGDGQVPAFLEFVVALRGADRHPSPWLAPLLHHLFGSEYAERLLREPGW